MYVDVVIIQFFGKPRSGNGRFIQVPRMYVHVLIIQFSSNRV